MLRDIVQKAAVAVVAAVKGPAEEPKRSRDPFYSDLERRAEVNASSRRARRRWLPRRRGGWCR